LHNGKKVVNLHHRLIKTTTAVSRSRKEVLRSRAAAADAAGFIFLRIKNSRDSFDYDARQYLSSGKTIGEWARLSHQEVAALIDDGYEFEPSGLYATEEYVNFHKLDKSEIGKPQWGHLIDSILAREQFQASVDAQFGQEIGQKNYENW